MQELHEEQELFRLLVNSVCPTVYGHEAVKAGVLLSLVGGAQGAGRRPNIHVLIVGDPGLGKSHMLHACASVAPRGRIFYFLRDNLQFFLLTIIIVL